MMCRNRKKKIQLKWKWDDEAQPHKIYSVKLSKVKDYTKGWIKFDNWASDIHSFVPNAWKIYGVTLERGAMRCTLILPEHIARPLKKGDLIKLSVAVGGYCFQLEKL